MELLDIANKDITLRDYQIQSKINIYKAWNTTPSVLFQMPTGTGKTRLFSSIIRDTQAYAHETQTRQPVLVLAHRTELIEQISETLGQKYHIAHGIIKTGYDEDLRFHVQVASVQSISRRLERWKSKDFRYIIIDEAHHVLAKTYKKILAAFPHAKILGVTATPYRLSGESFRDVFGTLIVSQSVTKFIEQGYLSEYQYFSIRPDSRMQEMIDNIDDIGLDGDYKEAALLEACDKDYIRANLVNSYKQFAFGKKGIIYTICKEHNEHVRQAFEEEGLRVVTIDSETPDKERKRLVKEFRSSRIDIICNVNIFSEGFDCPDIEFIQLARPTRSLSMYLQQVGRGLRPCEGKQGAIIMDNVGLYNRFGLPSANRQWKRHFEGKGKTEEPVVKKGGRIGCSKGRDFTEGDEDLELIYSFGTGALQEENHRAECQEAITALSTEEFFPMGLIAKANYYERQQAWDAIQNDNGQTSKEHQDRLKAYDFLYNDNTGWFPTVQYKDDDEWRQGIVEALKNLDDYDLYEQIENSIDSIVRFKYKGKYGVGEKKADIMDKVNDFTNEKIDWLKLNDFYENILEPIYDEIRRPDSLDRYVCIKDGKAGLINGFEKTEILPFIYDDIETVYNNLFIVTIAGKKGLVSSNSVVVQLEYESISRVALPTLGIGLMCERQTGYDYYDIANNQLYERLTPNTQLSDQWYSSQCPSGGFIITDESGYIFVPIVFEKINIILDEEVTFICTINKHCVLLKANLEYIDVLDEEVANKRYMASIVSTDTKSEISDGGHQLENAKLNKKDGFYCEKREYYIVKDNEIIFREKCQEISVCNLTNYYIIKSSQGYGILKYHDYVARTIVKPSYKSAKYLFDGYFLLQEQPDTEQRQKALLFDVFDEEYSAVLFDGNVSGSDLLIVHGSTGIRVYINKIQQEEQPYSYIEYLYDSFFKYRDANQQWGILIFSQKSGFKIFKEAIYTSISVRSAANSQVILTKEGERGRIVTIHSPIEL